MFSWLNKNSNLNARSAIISGCLISAFGALIFNILPMFLGSVQDDLGFNDRQLGWITSAYFAGFTISTLSAFYWVRKFNWRVVATSVSIATLITCTLLIISSSFTLYLLLMALLGTSTSAIYAIGTTYLGDTENPARSYGFKIGAEAALGALLMFLLPPFVVVHWGLQGLLISILVVFLMLTVSILWLPARGIKEGGSVPRSDSSEAIPLLPVILSLIALFLFFAGISALWAFIERIGNSAGFDATKVGLALSVSLVVAMSGSFLAAAICDRCGLFSPIVVSFLVMITALVTLNSTGYNLYFIGACLFALAYGFALPMQVTIVACFDTQGEYVVLTAVSIAIGGIVGPAVAGYLKAPDSYVSILLFTGAAFAVAVMIYGFVFYYARAHRLRDQQQLHPSKSPF